jgi:hypothetical protein
MRQELAYGLIAALVVAIAIAWLLSARKARGSRKGNLRIDLRKDRE